MLQNKGKDYIIYCKLECTYYWNKLDNNEAQKWAETALNLAKRDSREEKKVREALVFFLADNDINQLTTSQIDNNLSAQFYGNLGRCYFFIKEFDYSKSLLVRSFHLCYVQENSCKFLNRGYASYWLGQLLQKEGENKLSYFFYSNCMYYWKKHSPHRAQRVDEERKILQREIPDINDIYKMDDETIENQCRNWIEKQLQNSTKEM